MSSRTDIGMPVGPGKYILPIHVMEISTPGGWEWHLFDDTGTRLRFCNFGRYKWRAEAMAEVMNRLIERKVNP